MSLQTILHHLHPLEHTYFRGLTLGSLVYTHQYTGSPPFACCNLTGRLRDLFSPAPHTWELFNRETDIYLVVIVLKQAIGVVYTLHVYGLYTNS